MSGASDQPVTSGRATIREVAALAGVGTMTVSRVVNNSGYISLETRTKVEAAIEELHYLPNQNARRLRVQKSATIALIVTDITNPFFTTLARGVEDVARDHGYLVLLGNTDEDQGEESRYLKLLVQQGVDGVILVPATTSAGSTSNSNSFELARQHRLALVAVDRRVEDGIDCVRCDSEKGAFSLGEHLIKQGHRKFALLSGPADASTTKDRIAGFLRATKGFKIQSEVLYGEFSVADGARLAVRAMNSSFRPTAIFALNNFLTIGALNGLREAGFRIPEDISIVGFDDLPANLITFPFLTVCAQPSYELGRLAAERLFARIEDPGLKAESIILDTELVIRGSTANIRSQKVRVEI